MRKDDSEIEGRVVAVPSDDEVLIATQEGDVTLALSDVRRALVQVEFNRVDEVVPDDEIESDDEAGE